MNDLRQRLLALDPESIRTVQLRLCEHALSKWNQFVAETGEIRYIESVVGSRQVVDPALPADALAAVVRGKDTKRVRGRYSEPIVALQDEDLVFPEPIAFAYYAIFNLFEKVVLGRDIDDWLIVNQAGSSEEDVDEAISLIARVIEDVDSRRTAPRRTPPRRPPRPPAPERPVAVYEAMDGRFRAEIETVQCMGYTDVNLALHVDGKLALLETDPTLAGMAVSRDGRYLYVQQQFFGGPRKLRTRDLATREWLEEAPQPAGAEEVVFLTDFRAKNGVPLAPIGDCVLFTADPPFVFGSHDDPSE